MADAALALAPVVHAGQDVGDRLQEDGVVAAEAAAVERVHGEHAGLARLGLDRDLGAVVRVVARRGVAGDLARERERDAVGLERLGDGGDDVLGEVGAVGAAERVRADRGQRLLACLGTAALGDVVDLHERAGAALQHRRGDGAPDGAAVRAQVAHLGAVAPGGLE